MVRKNKHIRKRMTCAEYVKKNFPEYVVSELNAEIIVNPPYRHSHSGRSIHIDKIEDQFYDFGLGVGGGQEQLKKLCEGDLSSLASVAEADRASARNEEDQEITKRARECMGTYAQICNERATQNIELLQWVREKYGHSEEDVRINCWGYSDENVNMEIELKKKGFTREEILSTGAFHPLSNGTLIPTLKNRFIIPYKNKDGAVIKLAGRHTPWTPENEFERSRKYINIPTFDSEKRSYIAKGINDSQIYVPPTVWELLKETENAILVEGQVDAATLSKYGFPGIAVGSTTFSEKDLRILIDLVRRKTVYILPDNEVSEAGVQGALKTAERLSGFEIEAHIAVLPLRPEQEEARKTLKEEFGKYF